MWKYLGISAAVIASAFALAEMPTVDVVSSGIIFASLQYVMYLVLPGKSYLGPPEQDSNGNAVQVPYVQNAIPALLLTTFLTTRAPMDVTGDWKRWITFGNIVGLAIVWVLTYPVTSLRDWYCGKVLHPVDDMGVDWKLFIASRIGMMAWAMAAVSVLVSPNVSLGAAVSAALQYGYLFRFFWWEDGYVYSMDQQHDRAGFYICWGCLSAVPMLYWLPLVMAPQAVYAWDLPVCAGLLLAGTLFQILLYDVDRQKQEFRAQPNTYTVWGKPAKFVTHPTTGAKLLCSGWWGVSRHSHYLFEVLSALCWCAPVGGWSYVYPAYLATLLVHRCFRDDERCAAKYGQTWTEYCSKVPYKIVPYVF